MSGVSVWINNCAQTTFAWINISSGMFSGFISMLVLHALLDSLSLFFLNTYFFSSRVLQISFQTLVTNNQTSVIGLKFVLFFYFLQLPRWNRKHVSCLYSSSTKGSNFITCCGFLPNAFLVICPIVSKICWSSTLLTEYILYVSISIILLAWEVCEGCTDFCIYFWTKVSHHSYGERLNITQFIKVLL